MQLSQESINTCASAPPFACKFLRTSFMYVLRRGTGGKVSESWKDMIKLTASICRPLSINVSTRPARSSRTTLYTCKQLLYMKNIAPQKSLVQNTTKVQPNLRGTSRKTDGPVFRSHQVSSYKNTNLVSSVATQENGRAQLPACDEHLQERTCRVHLHQTLRQS